MDPLNLAQDPTPAPTGGGSFNPFKGVDPSFGPFDAILTSKVGMFLALVWAGCFVYTAYHLLVGVANFARSKKGGYGDDLSEVRTNVILAGAATVGLVAAPAIYVALLS
ncbi:hypothetical protein ACIOJE_34945 [Kitasatospora sp. NPDC087861]|uniref:hypothetical protein n=1 Tax=Kitasatospora sp. NPDC087861 TaxID=3364070 RepID=UPI003812C876